MEGADWGVNPSNQQNKEVDVDGLKVCLVGSSHSVVRVHGFWLNNLGHRVVWAKVEYPKEISTKFFADYYQVHNCTIFAIALGQWESTGRTDEFWEIP